MANIKINQIESTKTGDENTDLVKGSKFNTEAFEAFKTLRGGSTSCPCWQNGN